MRRLRWATLKSWARLFRGAVFHAGPPQKGCRAWRSFAQRLRVAAFLAPETDADAGKLHPSSHAEARGTFLWCSPTETTIAWPRLTKEQLLVFEVSDDANTNDLERLLALAAVQSWSGLHWLPDPLFERFVQPNPAKPLPLINRPTLSDSLRHL
jgi:hypothetical protein